MNGADKHREATLITIVLAVILAQSPASPGPFAGAPTTSTAPPADVLFVREAFGAIEEALVRPRPDPAPVAAALTRALDASCDRILGEGAKGVTAQERAVLSDAIAKLVRDSVVNALEASGDQRRESLYLLAREATSAAKAQEIIDRWLGLPAQPVRRRGASETGEPAGVAAQITKVPSAGDLQLVTESARLVAEVGGAGAGNGYVDTGEWVEIEVEVANGSPRPWYSSTVIVQPEPSCLWTPSQGIVMPELAARNGRGALRFWMYVSHDCAGASRKITLVIRDTHRAPSVDVTLGALLWPLELPAPRVVTARFDVDHLGSSDGSGDSEVKPGIRFEYGVDLAIGNTAAEQALVTYALPTDLRDLFTTFTYREVPSVRDAARIFRASDDLDAAVVGEVLYDRVLNSTKASRRWVVGRTPGQLWLAIDSSVEVQQREATPEAAPPAPVAPPAVPMGEAQLVALVRKHVTLVPHPVRPELPGSVAAASGFEVAFAASQFAEEYRALVWPKSAPPPPTQAAPLVYHFRQYQAIPLASRMPTAVPFPSRTPMPVEPPRAATAPPAEVSPPRFVVDLGGGVISYQAQPAAAPGIWGSGSRVEVGTFRARFTAGSQAALVAGVAWGWDGTGETEDTNFSEKEIQGGVGYRFRPKPGIELMPHVAGIVRSRELLGYSSETVVGVDFGVVGRFYGENVGLYVDLGGRAGEGGPGDLVSGSGFSAGGGLSILF